MSREIYVSGVKNDRIVDDYKREALPAALTIAIVITLVYIVQFIVFKENNLERAIYIGSGLTMFIELITGGGEWL